MPVIVYLGNRDTVDGIDRIPLPGKRCTTVQPPDGVPLAELIVTITDPKGVWAAHSDGAPAWVAVDCDDEAYGQALAQVLSIHFGGCEIREPDPNHQPSADDAPEEV